MRHHKSCDFPPDSISTKANKSSFTSTFKEGYYRLFRPSSIEATFADTRYLSYSRKPRFTDNRFITPSRGGRDRAIEEKEIGGCAHLSLAMELFRDIDFGDISKSLSLRYRKLSLLWGSVWRTRPALGEAPPPPPAPPSKVEAPFSTSKL